MKFRAWYATVFYLFCSSLYAVGPGHSGSWYWAEQDGHGFSVEIGVQANGSSLGVVYWYTYDDEGHPIFMVGSGVPEGDILNVTFTSPVGMIFGEFDPDTVDREDGGTGRFVFADEDTAAFQYEPSEFTAETWGHTPIAVMPLEKLFGIPTSESDNAELEARIKQLEQLLANVSRLVDPNTGEDTIRFTDMNVQVVNGTDSTDSATNGTGNLIIGYNETRPEDPVSTKCPGEVGSDFDCNRRSGSHMLVIGTRNNYSSFGGILAGDDNETAAPYGSINGGYLNVVSGEAASVNGGQSNTARGVLSVVMGGSGNHARTDYTTINGGRDNTASGYHATVTSGIRNTANGSYSTINGGEENTASGYGSSVSGGESKTASSTNCVVGDSGADC
jgi:hypothetical protein